jgi:hypothetical protein
MQYNISRISHSLDKGSKGLIQTPAFSTIRSPIHHVIPIWAHNLLSAASHHAH